MSSQTDAAPGTDAVVTWRQQVLAKIAAGARFAGLHATARTDGTRLSALIADTNGIGAHDVTLGTDVTSYPGLTGALSAAGWYEREIFDLFGLLPEGHPRLAPLILPLSEGATVRPRPGSGAVIPRLVPDEAALPRHVLGHGVFTIPHGPVRSGVFESVEYLVETPGEDISHLGIRVFGKHRGIERRFEDLRVVDGVLLAERVEGIASVAHALAYCHAIEAISGTQVPRRAAMVRVLHAELERIANHLDVAVKLADAAGLAVATARFALHKERTLRLVGALCNSRFGRGVIVPGGVATLPAMPAAQLRQQLGALYSAIRADADALMATPSFLDRLRKTGPLAVELASSHGALGPIGRASGFDDDDRRHRGYDGYRHLHVEPPTGDISGDAMARLRVRWAEIWASFTLTEQAVEATGGSADDDLLAPTDTDAAGRGVGWAEAPQGEVVYVVEVDAGQVVRCKPRSASFHNLALFNDLFHGDILTDFPFIEASFGLSIAGVAN